MFKGFLGADLWPDTEPPPDALKFTRVPAFTASHQLGASVGSEKTAFEATSIIFAGLSGLANSSLSQTTASPWLGTLSLGWQALNVPQTLSGPQQSCHLFPEAGFTKRHLIWVWFHVSIQHHLS